ncbi:MFS general substrate transporter, partial [Aureobasidium melanogenum]
MARAHKPALQQRQSSTLHYQTFPTPPPTSRGKPPTSPNPSSSNIHADSQSGQQDDTHDETPLPKAQLAILAVIALAEQTALNSISPYLPAMASTFPEVKDGQVGLYVGLIASSFALAQFATNFFWGWLSDRIGRKPVVLMGTLLTACCFVIFGFSRTLWQAIFAQTLMGLVNGNQGVISTCLGEITDRSNQSRAFTYLPVVYGIGGITGPLVGGLLVFETIPWSGKPNPYPYLAPNALSAGVLLIDFVLT